ncbi:MAG TPA: pitrilysin family protein [Gemmatimonadales bacterium]|nr:pitrilysin family protein [Gemmatimonadales bacterium]
MRLLSRLLHAVVPCALIVAARPAAAQAPVRVQHDTLANGLSVYLVPDTNAPIVTVDVWYDVGSANERPGRSGFAHLFEHLMFEGSAHVKPGEHLRMVEAAGGEANANTTEDRTDFHETLPENRLNLALWLEADRLRSLTVSESSFVHERETVRQERRQRVENQPYGRAFTDGLTLLYDSTDCFAYAHPVIGSLTDLDAATVADARAFYRRYYVPNNATLTVVGDFDPADAMRLIHEYFDGVPRAAAPPPVTCHVRYHAGRRERTWRDPLATLPAVVIAYLTPPHADPDTPSLELLTTMLGSGESSILNRHLVRERQIAVMAGAGSDDHLGPSVFYVYAIANQGVSAESLATALAVQVAEVTGHPVRSADLARAKNEVKVGALFDRQTTAALAEQIQHFVRFHGSAAQINTDLDRYLRVTPEDVRRVAEKYLVPDNSYTLVVVPRADSVTTETRRE